MTCDQLVDHATKPAWVDRGGIELPGSIGTKLQTDEHRGEVGVFGVPSLTLRKAVEHVGQLGHDLGVERGQTFAQLRPAERRHADLGEDDAAVAVGGELDEEEVEAARERVFRVEQPELRPERFGQVAHDLVDGRDEQILFRHEVVMNEARREARLGRDALDGRAGDAVFEDRREQAFDDLAAAWTREAGASHR